MTDNYSELDEMFPCDCQFLRGFSFHKGDPCRGCWQGKMKQRLIAWHEKRCMEYADSIIGENEKLVYADPYQKRSLEIRRNDLRDEQRQLNQSKKGKL